MVFQGVEGFFASLDVLESLPDKVEKQYVDADAVCKKHTSNKVGTCFIINKIATGAFKKMKEIWKVFPMFPKMVLKG